MTQQQETKRCGQLGAESFEREGSVIVMRDDLISGASLCSASVRVCEFGIDKDGQMIRREAYCGDHEVLRIGMRRGEFTDMENWLWERRDIEV